MLWCDKRGQIKHSLVQCTTRSQRRWVIPADRAACFMPASAAERLFRASAAFGSDISDQTLHAITCRCRPATATGRGGDAPEVDRNEGERHGTATRRLYRERSGFGLGALRGPCGAACRACGGDGRGAGPARSGTKGRRDANGGGEFSTSPVRGRARARLLSSLTPRIRAFSGTSPMPS